MGVENVSASHDGRNAPYVRRRPDNRRFQTSRGRRTPTYTCGSCGRVTRETGYDESSVELCRKCNAEALTENSISDGYITTAEQAKQAFMDNGGREEEFDPTHFFPAGTNI